MSRLAKRQPGQGVSRPGCGASGHVQAKRLWAAGIAADGETSAFSVLASESPSRQAPHCPEEPYRSPRRSIHRAGRCVGLGLAEDPSKMLLDPVDGVEKVPAVHVKATAAQTPIGAKEKVELEYFELFLIQISFRQQIEVGHKLFVFATPDFIPALARAALQSGPAEMLGFLNTLRNFIRQALKIPRSVQLQGFGDPFLFRLNWRNPSPWQNTQLVDDVPIASERFHCICRISSVGGAFGQRHPVKLYSIYSRANNRQINPLKYWQ